MRKWISKKSAELRLVICHDIWIFMNENNVQMQSSYCHKTCWLFGIFLKPITFMKVKQKTTEYNHFKLTTKRVNRYNNNNGQLKKYGVLKIIIKLIAFDDALAIYACCNIKRKLSPVKTKYFYSIIKINQMEWRSLWVRYENKANEMYFNAKY